MFHPMTGFTDCPFFRNPSTGLDNLVATRGWINFTRKDNGLNEYRSWSPSIINYDDDMTGTAGNGVMVQEDSFSADYNALNQPRWFWSGNVAGGFVSFGYDPLGRCVKRWNGGTWWRKGPALLRPADSISTGRGWTKLWRAGTRRPI